MQGYPYDSRPSRLTKWMRNYGVHLSLLAYFALFWTVYSRLFIESTSGAYFASWLPEADEALADLLWRWINNAARELGFRQFSPENIATFGFFPTLWLYGIRLQPLFGWHIHLARFVSLFFSKPPSPEPEGELEEAMKKTRSDHRPKAHCICIRVVTRGEPAAQSLVPRTVASALTLFSNMCSCEHLKAHVVTQTPFVNDALKRQWLDLGATEVREFFVPADYETPKRSLFRARNFCYWEATGGVGGDCREDESWILTLDEEVLITEQLVRSFVNDVLDNPDIQYALVPCLMDLRSDPVPLINKLLEAANVADVYCHMRQLIGIDRPPIFLFFHGGCYFVRADVDRERSNDCGPMASLIDDYSIGLTIADSKVGITCLRGWYVEGTTSTVAAFMTQRARFFRGALYSTWAAPMSKLRRFFQFSAIFYLTEYFFLYLIIQLILPLLLRSCLTPAGPPVLLLDVYRVFTFAVDATMYIFGACYMMSDSDVVLCILLAPLMIFIVAPVMYCLMMLNACKQIYRDWKEGAVAFYNTAKVVKVDQFCM